MNTMIRNIGIIMFVSACNSQSNSTITITPASLSTARITNYIYCEKEIEKPTDNQDVVAHLCVDSLRREHLKEYWNKNIDSVCSWEITSDRKRRCIPASANTIYYVDPDCTLPVALVEKDPYNHPRIPYIGLQKFYNGSWGNVFTIFTLEQSWKPDAIKRNLDIWRKDNDLPGIYWFYTKRWVESFEAYLCWDTYQFAKDLKGVGWFYLGEEVDPGMFPEL